MQLLDLIILALAAWRLAYFVTREQGPWRIAERFRNKFALGGLSTCLYCASFWTSILVLLLSFTPLHIVNLILAIGAAGLMLASYTGVNHGVAG